MSLRRRALLVAALVALLARPTAAQEGCGNPRPHSDYWCAFVYSLLQNYLVCPSRSFDSSPPGAPAFDKNLQPINDLDGDCFPGCFDPCPNDPEKNYETGTGCCGCGVPDIDTDRDEWPDCADECPSDPEKIRPGICGCDVADIDTDGDGTLDCDDPCKDDPKKVGPGVCGCGASDTDADADGTLDCNDRCPTDPNKINPGICGCNESEVPKCCPQGVDKCGVCGGNDSCVDCAGVPFGKSSRDHKNQCCLAGQRDACGLCFGDGSTCNVCFTTDVSATIRTVSERLSQQVAFFNRLVRTLSQSNCGSTKAGRRLIRGSRVKSGRIKSSSTTTISTIPVKVSSCEPCDDTNNTSSLRSYQELSNSLLDLSSNIIKARVSCNIGNGKCRGPIKECLRRVRSRLTLQRVDIIKARNLFSTTIESLNKVPLVTQTCK